ERDRWAVVEARLGVVAARRALRLARRLREREAERSARGEREHAVLREKHAGLLATGGVIRRSIAAARPRCPPRGEGIPWRVDGGGSATGLAVPGSNRMNGKSRWDPTRPAPPASNRPSARQP